MAVLALLRELARDGELAAELCAPRKALDVVPWAARELSCALPWEALGRSLGHSLGPHQRLRPA